MFVFQYESCKKWQFWLIALCTAIFGVLSSTIQFILLTVLTTQYYNNERDLHGNDSIGYELSYSMNALAQLANVLDSVVLTYGIFCFFKENELKISCATMMYGTKGKNIFIIVTCILLFVVQLLVSILPPVVLSVCVKETVPYSSTTNVVLAGFSISMEWCTHIYNLLVRLAMIFTTLHVRGTWLEARTDEDIEMTNFDKESFNKLIKHYKKIGMKVQSIQGIFQAWFVAKWILYFVEISAYATSALKPLSSGVRIGTSKALWFSFSHLLYDIFVFVTIYVCGSLMNYYHAKFYETLEEKLDNTLLSIFAVIANFF